MICLKLPHRLRHFPGERLIGSYCKKLLSPSAHKLANYAYLKANFKRISMTANNDTKLVSVFNGTPMEVEILCQVLKDNGIEASMKNQLIGMIAPHQTLDGADVLVMEKDKDEALKWVEEFKKAE